MEMKTFNDLIFENYSKSDVVPNMFKKAKQARITFENGYGVSVLFGKPFYSDGVETYELGVLFGSGITYKTEFSEGVYGYLTQEEVTDFMLKIQSWK